MAAAYAAVTPLNVRVARPPLGRLVPGLRRIEQDQYGYAGYGQYVGEHLGLATGADYRVTPDTLVGFALAGGGTSWKSPAALVAAEATSFRPVLMA